MGFIPLTKKSASTAKKNDVCRLYVQYEQSKIAPISDFEEALTTNNKKTLGFRTTAPPILCQIQAGKEDHSEFLQNIDKNKLFTIVIEGQDINTLQGLKGLYTSLESWETVGDINENLSFTHHYNSDDLKKVIQNKRKPATIISKANSFTNGQCCVHRFTGNPLSDTKHVLHVRFRGSDIVETKLSTQKNTTDKLFYFADEPLCTILASKEIVKEFYKNSNYDKEMIEFILKGNDLDQLKQIRDRFMNMNLRHEGQKNTVFEVYIGAKLFQSEVYKCNIRSITVNIGTVECEKVPIINFFKR